MQLQIVGNDIPLTMVGGARAPLEIQTVQVLRLMKSDNVRILVNLPIQNLQRLLWASKVFLHTADSEPFGLSIVEAMAAGCVPVIRKCGGAAEVVPIPELTFTNTSEARGIVRRALSGDFDHYLPQLQEHIRKFDESVFSGKFLAAVNQAGHWHMQAETGESIEEVR
jgi:glycosyltransferase involved in cell wall biosynthesis